MHTTRDELRTRSRFCVFNPKVRGCASMPVEPCRFYVRLTGVIVAVLFSASNAFAGASENCAAAAAYEYGQQDFSEALRLCRPLAEKGAKAQYALGFMYTNGEGVMEDHTEAALWYRRAANHAATPSSSASVLSIACLGFPTVPTSVLASRGR